MKKTTYEIKAKYAALGYITGTIDGLQFSALVFDGGSEFGINAGRVSKLWVRDDARKQTIINYERGWDVQPKTAADRRIFEALLEYLENLPTAETWEALAEGQPTPTKVRLRSGCVVDGLMKIDQQGYARIYDAQTGQTYKRLDPIAVRDMLEGK